MTVFVCFSIRAAGARLLWWLLGWDVSAGLVLVVELLFERRHVDRHGVNGVRSGVAESDSRSHQWRC